jgi:hypothetical protein
MATTLDLTIVTGKGIKISGTNGGIYIRNGNLKNFSWDSVNFVYYFNRQKGTDDRYDYRLVYSELTTYNSGGVQPYATILAAILAELDAEA